MNIRTEIAALGILTLLLAACGDAARATEIHRTDPVEKRSGRAEHSDPSDDLFAAPRVLELAIEVSPSESSAMLGDDYAYGRATLREGGASFHDVGLRYKGSPAKEAASGRPDFKLRFDKFDSEADFHGYKTLLLLSCRSDPSYLSATIGLDLFREAGVPAARYSFARIRLNGGDLGLYVVVEGVDRQFIGERFEQVDGNLYDEGHDPDITGKLERFGSGHGQPDVDALLSAALQSDPEQRWQLLQRLLDVDRFVSFAALEVLLRLDDSYSLEAKKFRIYHDPSTDRLVFFPKNVEEVLRKTDGSLTPEWKGIVARAVMTTPEGLQRYRETMAALLESLFTPSKVQERARKIAALIGSSVSRGDPAAAAAYEASVARFVDAAAKRVAFASEQLGLPPSR